MPLRDSVSLKPGEAASRCKNCGRLWISLRTTSPTRLRAFFELPRITARRIDVGHFACRQVFAAVSPRILHVPARLPRRGLHVAVADPTDAAAVRAAEIVLGAPLQIASPPSKILPPSLRHALEDEAEAAESVIARGRADDDVESLRDLPAARRWCAPSTICSNGPLTCEQPISTSNRFESGLVVRMRVDGLLRKIPTPSRALPQAIISRVKILAGLNIAERRLPQDGAARQNIRGIEVDIRVATMPTQHGEAAVLRLLPKDRGLLDIGKLGIAPADEARITRLPDLPHGMIVITGPTGSGKTTTLATMLSDFERCLAQNSDY